LCPDTEQVVRDLGSYTEISSSGTGLHVILTGERSPEFKTKGRMGCGTVEVYDQGRYFVITGNRYQPDELPLEPKPAGAAFEAFERRYLQVRDNTTSSKPNSKTTITDLGSNPWTGTHSAPLSRVEVRSMAGVTPQMVYATGREYDSTFAQLWDGGNIGNKSDDSELDASFVSKLVFYCGGDKTLMDDCFRSSARHGIRTDRDSPKWDEVHSSDGRTYGQMLLDKACKWNSDRYKGKYIRPD
jgi:putative DNA primase/helicase